MTEEKLNHAPILFSAPEVSDILGVSLVTIYAHIKDGSLKARKVCNRWRITKDDLQEFIDRGSR